MQTELYTMHGTIAPDDVEAGVTPQPSTALRLDAALGARLHRQAQAARWGLSVASFTAALEHSAAKALGDAAGDRSKVERYLTSLHLEDLALASACAEGIEAAWDHFVLEYRPVLYRSADAIDPGGGARELADSIYADLFGLQERDGERRSLFRYFHGRSSLATWLRAVLAQRQVDRVRSTRRLDALEPLEAQDAPPPPLITSPDPDPDIRRFVALIKVDALAGVVGVERSRSPSARLLLPPGSDTRANGAFAGRARSHGVASARAFKKGHPGRGGAPAQGRGTPYEAEIARCFECTDRGSGSLDVAELFSEVGSRKDPGS